MDLSVIIVCYRGWDSLSVCLEALEELTLKSFSMEVIIVDNNSADGKLNEFESRFVEFRFIRSNINGGYAFGCNLGAAAASGDYLMILNPDAVIRGEEAHKLLERAKLHPEYTLISCRQLNDYGRECKAAGKFPGTPLRRIRKNDTKSHVSFPDWISGSLMIISRKKFRELNGFDESFWMYFEDVDICLRARKTGGEIAYYSDVSIRHSHGGSSRINLATTSITKTEVQISRHLFIHKHLAGPQRTLMHMLTITDNILTGFLSGVAGLLFFFVPKLFVRFLILLRIVGYYRGALARKSWISPRSVRSGSGKGTFKEAGSYR